MTFCHKYAYDAFGNLLASTGALSQPYGYVGQEFYYTGPNLGLQLLGMRWYDPQMGRFVARDPIGTRGGINLYGYVDSVGKPLNTNLYSYAENNPVNYSDPTGLQKWIPFRAEPPKKPVLPDWIKKTVREFYENFGGKMTDQKINRFVRNLPTILKCTVKKISIPGPPGIGIPETVLSCGTCLGCFAVGWVPQVYPFIANPCWVACGMCVANTGLNVRAFMECAREVLECK